MHELSIVQSLIDEVLDKTGGRAVSSVNLRIGPLSGVLPDALRFCFDVASAGTALAGARLRIDEPQGRGRCRTCGDHFALTDIFLLCPCGSADVDVVAGRELRLVSVEVA
ncbi:MULTISPECIES: hydrogenase maturation nickel metallochaperone HypA [unclassified Arthrobacter]|uniref:hydrogenase maturation nickel metallochaperone HypA/HybF n=1 Tax=unclassified Arthrobacter TaxID=235627 RepID=UPI003394B0A3